MITRKSIYWALAPTLCVVVNVLLACGCGAGGAATASTGTVAKMTPPARRPEPQIYMVRTGAMEPTIPLGAKATFERERSPKVGAVVIAHPPEGAVAQQCGPKPHAVVTGGAACETSIARESNFELVERIVAGPGDEIYIREGHVFRRGRRSKQFVRESDAYTKPCGGRGECNFPTPIRVAAGHWFLMGDNRGESTDSRFWGPIPTAWIIGIVVQVHKPKF